MKLQMLQMKGDLYIHITSAAKTGTRLRGSALLTSESNTMAVGVIYQQLIYCAPHQCHQAHYILPPMDERFLSFLDIPPNKTFPVLRSSEGQVRPLLILLVLIGGVIDRPEGFR